MLDVFQKIESILETNISLFLNNYQPFLSCNQYILKMSMFQIILPKHRYIIYTIKIYFLRKVFDK